jgi:hypothetical protein
VARARPPARAKEPDKEESRVRRFFLEFASVTMGVLLALVLEQAVAQWRERQRVSDQRASMDSEISDFAEIARLRERVAPCITRKLDALEAHLRGKSSAAVTTLGHPPFFFSSRGAWNSDASDQLSRHLGSNIFSRYGEIYQGIEQFAALSAEEQAGWVPLQTLEGDSDPIGPDRRAHLRESIAQARNANRLMLAVATQMLELAHSVGVKPNGGLRSVRIEAADICRPLGGGK